MALTELLDLRGTLHHFQTFLDLTQSSTGHSEPLPRRQGVRRHSSRYSDRSQLTFFLAVLLFYVARYTLLLLHPQQTHQNNIRWVLCNSVDLVAPANDPDDPRNRAAMGQLWLQWAASAVRLPIWIVCRVSLSPSAQLPSLERLFGLLEPIFGSQYWLSAFLATSGIFAVIVLLL